LPQVQGDLLKLGSAVVVEPRKDLVLGGLSRGLRPLEKPRAGARELQGTTPPIVGRGTAGQEASRFEPVQQRDQVAGVHIQTSGQLTLAGTAVTLEKDQGAQFAWSQFDLDQRCNELPVDGFAEPHEQETERRAFLALVGHAQIVVGDNRCMLQVI
jgi:hypothetical protein